MQALPIFKQRHEELLGEVTLLRSLITKEQLANKATASLAHQKLCQLVVTMKQHLAEEDRGIYPELLTHSDPKLKAIAWNFIGGQKPLNKIFLDYSKKLNHCQYEFNDELIKETQEIMHLLCKRIESERDILFPQLEASGVA